MVSGFAAAKKNNDILALKASQELAVLSQSVVKDYFYIAKDLNALQARAQMKKYQNNIDEHIKFVSENVKDAEVQEMLRFMEITRDEMKGLLDAPYTEDNAFLVLDMSEVLLEGAESISDKLNKMVKGNNSALAMVEKQLFLIERMAKLYISAQAGLFDFNSKQQMVKAIADFDAGLQNISRYDYPAEHLDKVVKLKKHWESSRKFYEKAESGSLPRTVFLATELMVHPLRSLTSYHVSKS